MSEERKKIIHAFGGEIIFTPAKGSLPGSIKKMREITEAEKVDVFVAGVGSGGTLQGIGKFLKEKNPKVKIVAVEPKNSSALLGQEPGLHQIQGIGDGFIPAVLDVKQVDMVFTVTDEEAIETTRQLSKEEGLLVGTSSGANVFAALHVDNGRNRVVTVLPDRAERYFSTALL
jgi:cysteine synthase A